MVLIVLLVLAPLLAFAVADRRIVVGVLVAVWGLVMIPQTYTVLLDEQLRDRSLGNTAAYFIINELMLVAAVALAMWIHRKRHSPAATTAPAPAEQVA